MSHLGALITPYVDGELSPARAAEARAHLRECDECRRAVAQEQTASRRTQDSVRDMQASAELTARLLAMTSGSLQPSSFAAPRRSRAPFVLGGGAALVGLFVLSLFVLGGPREAQPPTALLGATDASSDDLQMTARPASSGADAPASTDWVLPSTLSVTSMGMLDDGAVGTLDLTVSVPQGDVRLLEQPGHLADSIDGIDPVDIAGHVVYEVDGWYVLESGHCVVAVHAADPDAAEAVIAQLPVPGERSVLDRLADGWRVLVD